jgi:hypothetical protein
METIKDTVDLLVQRTRQNGGIAVDLDTATEVLTICQQIINIALQRVTVTDTLTTSAYQNIYEHTPGKADVLSLFENNKELLKANSLHEIAAYDPQLFTTTGTTFTAWCPIGRRYFFLYPAKTNSSTIGRTYVYETVVHLIYADLSTETMEMQDEDLEKVLRLAEMVLLLRSRDVTLLEATLATFNDLMRSAHG